MADIKHVTIIGVGLLGGSAGLAIKSAWPKVKIAGVGRRKKSLDEALRIGAIDTAHLNAAEAVAESDLVILATPVRAFEEYLRKIAPLLKRGAIVTDVGSTKAFVVRAAERILGKRRQFIGSHPMAGSEQKGATFARADLFTGATCIITPTSHTPRSLITRIEKLWQALGMRTVRMNPAEHDKAAARISHLPHVLAGLLMLLPKDADLKISAGGFRDATRLASGDPEMWRDILVTNRQAILDAIDDFDEALMHLRDLLERGDSTGLEQFLAAAKTRRDKTIARILADRRVAVE